MPPKTSKKRSRCDSALVEADPPPIKFISPGFTADTCINVFGQDYHVNSMILKLHSSYFRKFLDSADKPNAPATAIFKYNYGTVVDADDIWAVEPKSTVSFRYSLVIYPIIRWTCIAIWPWILRFPEGIGASPSGQPLLTWPAIYVNHLSLLSKKTFQETIDTNIANPTGSPSDSNNDEPDPWPGRGEWRISSIVMCLLHPALHDRQRLWTQSLSSSSWLLLQSTYVQIYKQNLLHMSRKVF